MKNKYKVRENGGKLSEKDESKQRYGVLSKREHTWNWFVTIAKRK